MIPEDEPVYVIYGATGQLVECWPWTADGQGAITATVRAAALSRGGEPHQVHRPDGQLLARFADGQRTDLDRPAAVLERERRQQQFGDWAIRTITGAGQ